MVYGIITYSLPHQTITKHFKESGKVITKNQTLEEISNFTHRLHHLNSGENWINREFHTFFAKTRINKWNELVNDENKIIYKVNDIVVSDWKGSKTTNT